MIINNLNGIEILTEQSHKTCTRCKTEKLLSDFNQQKTSKDGKTSYCKVCVKEVNKPLRDKNKEKYSRQYKEWYKNNKERALQKSKKWKENNKERALQKSKEWRENNKQKIQENYKYRFSVLKISAKKRQIPMTISIEQFAGLDKLPCHYCNNKKGYAGHGLDRIDSLKGYTLENVVPCCRVCNILKSNKDENWPEMIDQLERTLQGLKQVYKDQQK